MDKRDRYCGILIHPTSFNSPYGIGDLGQEARLTLTKLASAGVRLWQVLPLGPTGYGDSPYASRSSFAGNELMIDLRQIEGFECPEDNSDRSARVDYPSVYANKLVLLKKAASRWLENHKKDAGFVSFCKKQSWWLDDYALYQCLVNKYNDSRWYVWNEDVRDRKEETLAALKKELSPEIEIYRVLQYFFYTQWDSLHRFANDLGIRIIGDIPIFCAGDSVDVWTNRKLFKIDAKGKQKAGAGVPPDAFSSTGQLWGNPVYDWKEHEKDDFAWYRRRVEMTLKMVDIVRIDHFRGLESYWEVPAIAPDASYGKWVKGPGMKLVKYFADKDIIAEDLGVITPQVEKLLADSSFPGMKVLQFAFDLENGNLKTDNYYLPFNYSYNCAAYTGTHDNDTSRSWFNNLSPEYRDIVRRFLQCPDEDVVWQMMRALLSSCAKYVIFPMQDLMDLGGEARMNAPSTVSSCNWSWRMNPANLEQWRLDRLREYIKLYGLCL